MRTVALSEICDISSGGTPSRGNPELFKGDIPWAKISDIENSDNGVVYTTEERISNEGLKNIRGRLFPKGTLLFAMYGSIGKSAIAGIELSSNQAILGIRPKTADEVDLFYLKMWFDSNKQALINQGRGVALKNLSATIVRNLKIDLPRLDDQKRIAHLLGRVEGLIARRKQHLRQLDDLLKSVFLEMFGDPIRNEKGLEVRSLGDLATIERGRFSPRPRNDPKYFHGIHPFIQTGDISRSRGRLRDYSQTLNELGIKVSKEFKVGTIVIAIVGATIGETAILEISTYAPDSVIGIVPRHAKNQKVESIFLEFLLRFWKPVLRARAPEAARANINIETLRPLPIIWPQNVEREKFAAIVEEVEGLKSRYQQSLADLEKLYGALSQKAFKGELDLSRVPLPVEATADEAQEIGPNKPQENEMFELPAPADLAAILSPEGRKNLIDEWLTAWLDQLGDVRFSAQAFMDAAQQRLWDLAVDDEAPEWGAAEYDEVKTWIFEALEQGRMIQGYDDANNSAHITAAKG